jgi:GTPase SAR1 family protein
MSVNLQKNALKIGIVGPQRVGKSTITNFLSEFSHVVTGDYHPTVGTRILEMEKTYTDEQARNIPILKNNKLTRVKIELWDISGDRRYESSWPACQYGLNGVIIVIDATDNKYDNVIDDWMNGFCKNVNPDYVICFSYKKDNSKGIVNQKRSNQFPNMIIGEVTSNMDTLLPNFNKLIHKILIGLS